MQVGERNLPQDIVINILSRLPVKLLIRFKSVSKKWLKLISDYVKQKHDMIADQNPYLVVWDNVYGDESEEEFCCCCMGPKKVEVAVHFSIIDPLEEKLHNRFELQLSGTRNSSIQVCHGLCLMEFSYDYILNPSTRGIVKLPFLQGNVYEVSRPGFGYLANKNEYKIVKWFKYRHLNDESSSESENESADDQKIGCQIFTLTDGFKVKSETWRVGQDRPYFPLHSSLCVNGVIYWLSWSRWVQFELEKPKWWDLNHEFNYAIFSFDLEKEEYQLRPCRGFPLSSSSQWQPIDLDLVESEDCLCIGKFFDKESTLKLWRFKHDIFELKYSIKFPSNIIDDLHTALVSCISKSGDDEELIFIIENTPDTLVYYNTRSETFRRSTGLAQRVSDDSSQYKNSFLCFDTLFCLGGV